jgi:hypothetical protein
LFRDKTVAVDNVRFDLENAGGIGTVPSVLLGDRVTPAHCCAFTAHLPGLGSRGNLVPVAAAGDHDPGTLDLDKSVTEFVSAFWASVGEAVFTMHVSAQDVAFGLLGKAGLL